MALSANPVEMSEGSTECDSLRAKAASLSWWHHIDLGNGVVTEGVLNPLHQDWVTSHLPSRFDRLSVLDIGAWDGYYSFLAEERGAARVLAVDSLQNERVHASGTAPFELAKAARRSKVEYRVMDVMDLEELEDRFDCILFLGVYYHLREPWKALALIRRHTNPGGRVFLEGLLLPGRKPILQLFRPPEFEETTYCAATESGLARLAETAGFTKVRQVARYGGLGSMPFVLWRCIPRGMVRNGGLDRKTLTARVISRTMRRFRPYPRIIMEFQV